MRSDFQFGGKHVLVIGIKRSGAAAIELLLKQGARVFAMDAQPLSPEEHVRFASLGVSVLPQTPDNMNEYGEAPDVIVISPAVPFDLPMLMSARLRGIPVIGEVELSSYFLKGPVIGITGSNGKTTTTALTGHVLRQCGIPCQVGGNIGTAVTSLIDSSAPEQWNVLELSSFQLESISHFRAGIAACLNITPDHLDRHHTFENYAAAKARLFETQKAGDFAVLNYDDSTVRQFADKTKAEVWWFSSHTQVPAGVWMNKGELYFDTHPFLHRSQIKLRGLHNVENVMAASVMARLAGASVDSISDAVEMFLGVEHRIEFVRNLNGVEYFNDSKATNVDAALKAIAAFSGGLWIILGGKDKGSDYLPLREALAHKARAALLIGEAPPYPYAAAPLIREALKGVLPLVDCATLPRAVQYARQHAEPGDVVLLAPACASFDQFESYEHRGNTFKHLVTNLF